LIFVNQLQRGAISEFFFIQPLKQTTVKMLTVSGRRDDQLLTIYPAGLKNCPLYSVTLAMSFQSQFNNYRFLIIKGV